MNNLEQFNLPTNNFGYSGVPIGAVELSEMTLATLVIDESGSIMSFRQEMVNAVKEIIKALRNAPRRDNLMLRTVTFSNNLSEFHGYKPLMECNEDDYNNIIRAGQMTALFDATENAMSAHTDYSRQLTEMGYDVNGIVVVITDGWENHSGCKIQDVKKSIENATKSEAMTSLVSILIGVDIQEPEVETALKKFKEDAGIQQFVAVNDASAKTLSKVANFVSQSISQQSQNISGSGPSQPISLSI